MKRMMNKTGFGPQGIGIIEINRAKRKARITLTVDDVEKKYIVDLDNCPKSIQAGKFFVSLSPDGSKVMGLRPVQGMFTGKVERFNANKNEQPAPKTDQKFGYQYFTATLQITGDECKGMEIPLKLMYWFCADEQGNVAFEYHPKSKYYPLLEDFCAATGFTKSTEAKPLLWPASNNILPNMEKRILRMDKEFKFTMKNGWVMLIYPEEDEYKSSKPVPDEEAEEEENWTPIEENAPFE